MNEQEDARRYVFERSIELQKEYLKSVGRSIENERTKAGIILGFYFLIIASETELFSELSCSLNPLVFVLLVVVLYFLLVGFCSRSVKDGVDITDTFCRDWEKGSEEKFLKQLSGVLNVNLQDQRKLLTRISDYVKYSVVLLSIIMLALMFNSSTDMFQFLGSCVDPGSLESGEHELSEPPVDTSGENANSLISGEVQKGL